MTFRRLAIMVIVYYIFTLILQVFTAPDGTVSVVNNEGAIMENYSVQRTDCIIQFYTL